MIVEVVALILGFFALMAILMSINAEMKRRHFMRIAEIDTDLAAEYIRSNGLSVSSSKTEQHYE